MDSLALSWRVVLEISILWLVIYVILLFIKETGAIQALKGIIMILVVYFLVQTLDLKILDWMLTKLLTVSVFAFLIIFQPELRRGLAKIGQIGIFLKEKESLEEIAKSAKILSKKKIGGIIAIEREMGLGPYVESGVKIDSQVTSELLNTIFMPNTPLHDGAVIIKGGRLVAAGCLFPLTQNPNISKTLGTRHRAAIGLSEETDSVVVIVSEETGNISIAINGKLTRNLEDKDLFKILSGIIQKPKRNRSPFDFFNRMAKKIKIAAEQ